MRVIGIDLGTTNSVVAYVDENGEAHAVPDETGSRITPSVVYFPLGEERMEIGEIALKQAVLEPSRVARLFKRGIGGDTFLPSGEMFEIEGRELRPELLSSFVVHKLAAIASSHLGETISDVVITVPAYFGESERAATRTAGELAGLNVHLLPAEPMAAAVAHGLEDTQSAATVLVFDLGGGTFDVTILRRGGDGALAAVAHEGDRELGGADFDRAIVNEMAALAASEAGADLFEDPEDLAGAFEAAEDLKKELSRRDKAETILVIGGKRLRFELTLPEFETLIADAVEATELTVERALDAAELGREAIDSVLMVGGSSRIPAFAKMLEGYFSKPPLTSRNLDEDVARGAALMGALKLGLAPEGSALSRLPEPRDILSHGLGVEALNDEGVLENVVLLASQTPFNTEPVKHTFGTAVEGQRRIEIVINEGDNTDLRFVDKLGSGTGDFDEPKPMGYAIAVEMSLTDDGMVKVSACDGESGRHLCDVVVERKRALPQADADVGTEMLASYEVL